MQAGMLKGLKAEIIPKVLPKSYHFLQLIHHCASFVLLKKKSEDARGVEVLKSYCSLKLLIKAKHPWEGGIYHIPQKEKK